MSGGGHRIGRWLTTAAVVAGTVVVPLAIGPAQPAAANFGYVGEHDTPVTWIDGQGRQVLVASNSFQTLQVLRDTPVGDPDLTWGQNGARNVVFDLPEGAADTSPLMAADDSGVVTLVHPAADCDDQACDLWFQRVDPLTGDAMSAPVEVSTTLGPWRGLDDGSFLMRTTGNHLEWRGADGTDRGSLGQTTDEIVDADVDAAGRLLVLEDDGTLTRRAAGAAVDLTLATGCDQSAHDAVVGASSAATGFAVACDPGADDGVRATRYADNGTVAWTAASTAPDAPDGFATEVTVTAADVVWVGIRTVTVDPAEPTVGLISASPASSIGWGERVDLRKTGQPSYFVLGPIADYGGGVVQLRPLGTSSKVGVADLRVCCQYPNRTSVDFSAHSYVIPHPSGPPNCATAPVTMRSPSAGVLQVSFAACPPTLDPGRRPTSYRVDLVVDGTTTTKTVADQGSATNAKATFTGIGNGKLAKATVTPFNAEGDSTALPGPSWEATIFPFAGAADFVYDGAEDLGWRHLSASEVAPYYFAVRDGSRSAASIMDEFLTDGTARRSVELVSRIYRAAFLRDADSSGLRYWVGRHRAGVRIATIAEQFSRSSEFQRRYGTLTNRQFVSLIYANVLGRPGDPAGIDFWTKRLDMHRATRGAVLANFSESGEFARKTLGRAQVTTVTLLMLNRAPTASELATWSTAEDVYGTMPATILATEVYADRVRAG